MTAMQSWRQISLKRAITWATIIAAIVFVLGDFMLGVLLGSLGMDIHPACFFMWQYC